MSHKLHLSRLCLHLGTTSQARGIVHFPGPVPQLYVTHTAARARAGCTGARTASPQPPPARDVAAAVVAWCLCMPSAEDTGSRHVTMSSCRVCALHPHLCSGWSAWQLFITCAPPSSTMVPQTVEVHRTSGAAPTPPHHHHLELGARRTLDHHHFRVIRCDYSNTKADNACYYCHC